MPLYIGLDVGTQSTKALVWDSKKKKVLSRGAKSYPILPTDIAGRAEQSPSTWLDAGQCAIADALRSVDPSQVRAIGVSGQQHGLVALDKHGDVIRNAKLWCDVEAAAQAERLSEASGWTIVPGFTAPKIAWLKDEEPDNFDRLAHVLLPHDFFNYYLTGVMAMECGDASGTGLFDVVKRAHDEAAMARIDAKLPGCFPPLIGANDVLGRILPGVAAQLGLPEDVIVAPGSGDNMMSALGAGSVRPGDLVVSLGTSGTMFVPSSSPVFDRTGTIAPFCSATGVIVAPGRGDETMSALGAGSVRPGDLVVLLGTSGTMFAPSSSPVFDRTGTIAPPCDWLPLLCTMNCTGPPDAVRAAFGMSLDAIAAAAAAAPPGCSGVNFLPYLAGERTPQWPHATGAITGLRPGSLQPGLLYRAALEGSSFSLLAGLGLLRENGVPAQDALLVGGGSKSALWRQIIADILQIPLKFPVEPESAALGGALQAAAVHQGALVAQFVLDHLPDVEETVVLPDPSVVGAYDEAYARHCSLGSTLFGQIIGRSTNMP